MRIMVAPDGRVVFLPETLGEIAVLDAELARWSIIDAAGGPGKRNAFHAFLVGRRLIIWGGETVETGAPGDGWMILLPR
jgi:hypothetical protein